MRAREESIETSNKIMRYAGDVDISTPSETPAPQGEGKSFNRRTGCLFSRTTACRPGHDPRGTSMEISPLTDAPLYAALTLMGIAYFQRTYSREGRKITRRSAYSRVVRKWQMASAAGWITLGLMYSAMASAIVRSRSPDYVNASILFLILPVALYLAYHELLSVRYNQEMKSLRFLNGVVFLFVLPVTLADRIPAVNGAIIYSFAWQSAKLLTVFGYDMHVSSVDYQNSPMLYRANHNFISTTLIHGGHNDIDIILSCTALPSMLLFAAAIACSSAPVKERLRTGVLMVGLIHVLNVLRVSVLTFLIYEGLIEDFFAHAVVGKAGSIIILLLLVMLLFKRLPDIRDCIYRLFILHHRRPPVIPGEGRTKYGREPGQSPGRGNADIDRSSGTARGGAREPVPPVNTKKN